ncbi:unnamed protein product [Cuscuta epithymum]|uniref:Uncharacterized protein n=1 Tax=Cuscuta epithymum TaxID=186058 RepID=A0AAV0CPU5_9ASTE|nr:unnamed protein product [Cuscuta epithymum]
MMRLLNQAKSPIEPEPWCLGWAPPGTRSRPRMTKKNLEAERTRPNKMGVPDPAAYAKKYYVHTKRTNFFTHLPNSSFTTLAQAGEAWASRPQKIVKIRGPKFIYISIIHMYFLVIFISPLGSRNKN